MVAVWLEVSQCSFVPYSQFRLLCWLLLRSGHNSPPRNARDDVTIGFLRLQTRSTERALMKI
jgi:hypothetical protein